MLLNADFSFDLTSMHYNRCEDLKYLQLLEIPGDIIDTHPSPTQSGNGPVWTAS